MVSWHLCISLSNDSDLCDPIKSYIANTPIWNIIQCPVEGCGRGVSSAVLCNYVVLIDTKRCIDMYQDTDSFPYIWEWEFQIDCMPSFGWFLFIIHVKIMDIPNHSTKLSQVLTGCVSARWIHHYCYLKWQSSWSITSLLCNIHCLWRWRFLCVCRVWVFGIFCAGKANTATTTQLFSHADSTQITLHAQLM